MPNLPIPEPDDTGEEIVSMRDGSGSSLPDMPPTDPVLFLWRGKYQMRMDGDVPVIVPRLIPHVMRPGIGGMGERKGDLAITERVELEVRRSGGVAIRHPRLPSYLRRRRVRGADPTRPVYHYYLAWHKPTQRRNGSWYDRHDEAAFVRFLLSLYAIPDLIPTPTEEDLDELREARQLRIDRHVNAVDERDRLALVAEQRLRDLEEAAAATIARTSGCMDTGEEEVVDV